MASWSYTPLRACRGIGENGAKIIQLLAELALAFFDTRIIASRLSKFNENICKVRVVRDEKRELLILEVIDHDGTVHQVSSVSAGTLRFLAMIALDLDTRAGGLICLEEPENSIYPDRIPEVLELLQDIAANPTSRKTFWRGSGSTMKDITYFRTSYQRANLQVDISGLYQDQAARKVKEAVEELDGKLMQQARSEQTGWN
jgi:AAA15 family ATPase/GTPase